MRPTPEVLMARDIVYHLSVAHAAFREAQAVLARSWRGDFATPIDRATGALAVAARLVRVLPVTPGRAELRVAIRRARRCGELGDAADAVRRASPVAVRVFAEVNRLVRGGPVADVRAMRLACWAATVLPVPDRARYREEFEAELVEITRGRRQLVHALRLLVRAVPLRRELRRPARERAR